MNRRLTKKTMGEVADALLKALRRSVEERVDGELSEQVRKMAETVRGVVDPLDETGKFLVFGDDWRGRYITSVSILGKEIEIPKTPVVGSAPSPVDTDCDALYLTLSQLDLGHADQLEEYLKAGGGTNDIVKGAQENVGSTILGNICTTDLLYTLFPGVNKILPEALIEEIERSPELPTIQEAVSEKAGSAEYSIPSICKSVTPISLAGTKDLIDALLEAEGTERVDKLALLEMQRVVKDKVIKINKWVATHVSEHTLGFIKSGLLREVPISGVQIGTGELAMTPLVIAEYLAFPGKPIPQSIDPELKALIEDVHNLHFEEGEVATFPGRAELHEEIRYLKYIEVAYSLKPEYQDEIKDLFYLPEKKVFIEGEHSSLDLHLIKEISKIIM